VALYFGAAGKDAAPKPVPLPQSNPLKAEKGKQQNSKPAMALFSEKQLPSIGKAVAIGYYPRGCLQGGVELPITGPTWQVMRVSRNRNWGHPELVKFLERFAPLADGAAAWRPPSLRTQKPSSRARRRHLVHADARSCIEPAGTRQYRGQ
jgi:penicillin-insensitive murein endopeptidase